MKEIVNTADVVYSASLSCEVCNQLMEPLVSALPIRQPNCLSHSSLTFAPSFLLPFFLLVCSPHYHSRMLNKTVGRVIRRREQKDLALVPGLLMKLFSNLNPEGPSDVATILRPRAPIRGTSFSDDSRERIDNDSP